MSDTTIKLLVAAIPGLVSLIVAGLSLMSAKRNQANLETLRSELAERKSERDALRDYQYEARKRLYQEIEPLNFQLIEAAEHALHRIYGLARTAKHGALSADGWLSRDGYYALSTMYKLIMPVAIFRLIQQKLTAVDLTVDPNINAQYLLAKTLYISFTDDFVLAKTAPVLHYDPNRLDWHAKRAEDQRVHWRQGIPLGHLDDAADALLKHDGSGRWLSFGSFQTQYKDQKSEVCQTFMHVRTLIQDFHPQTRPVLWRMLVTQAHLYLALLSFRQVHVTKEARQSSGHIQAIPVAERALFEYRPQPDEATHHVAMVEPFDVAQSYLRQRVGELFAPTEESRVISVG
ncbi:MAG: hypothetical protein ACJ74W_00035 [Pyrinomonadaceae bacterium]